MSEERNPNSLQELLKVCLEASGSNIINTNVEPLDSETQQWLQGALNCASSIIEEMLKCIEQLKNGIEKIDAGVATEETYLRIKASLDILIEDTGSIDYAEDFHKIGGFEVLKPLLNVPNPEVRSRTAELIAELVQNNPYCQQNTLSMGFLKLLLERLENDENETARIKCLYAISCLIRQNCDALKQFENEDGFSVLLRTMQQSVEKLKIKSAFLLMIMCEQSPAIGETLYSMGFVEQLVALIHSEHTTSHEYLVGALLTLIKNNEHCKTECKRSDLKLKELLNTRIKELEGKEEHKEEWEYCQQLLNLCFYQEEQDEIESER